MSRKSFRIQRTMDDTISQSAGQHHHWDAYCDDFPPDNRVNVVNGCASIQQRQDTFQIETAAGCYCTDERLEGSVRLAFAANQAGPREQYVRADVIRQVFFASNGYVPNVQADIPPMRLIGEREYRRRLKELLTYSR
jgi:hypothetical protein